ncbi:Pex19-domain-containing protein [Rickenella mellea]|uniref:Pex19-domain-containing protein n=1 Tax=Rickenella mellea TaxID=50990 RepID=A0A4Y7Q0X4_9AGAM|nr:Pex19-domain-containing protein [Rickenella mellea]
MSSSTQPRVHEDDDDLDDLDDIVDQFDTTPAKPPQPTASSSTPPVPPAPPIKPPPNPQDTPELSDDFVKQLAADMEALMRDLAGDPATGGTEEERKQREVWEQMLVSGLNGEDSNTPGDASGSSNTEDAFQSGIRKAMDKLRTSDTTLSSDASAAAASTDPLEALLSQLGSGLDGSGENEDEMQGMLETMMQQLMSKEVLYEPLKELRDKFPAYLSENASKLSMEDKSRFNNQLDCVTKIVAVFEDPTYSDDNHEKGAQVATLMNEMQSFGSPPTEIMGDLPPGLELGPDGLPKMPDGCVIC